MASRNAVKYYPATPVSDASHGGQFHGDVAHRQDVQDVPLWMSALNNLGGYFQTSALFNLGGFYDFNEHVHFLFSGGDTLAGERHTLGYLGLQYTW